MADKLKKKFKGECIMQKNESYILRILSSKDNTLIFEYDFKTKQEAERLAKNRFNHPRFKHEIVKKAQKKPLNIFAPKESSQKSIKALLEAANRKCEMRWKVLVFDPNKDNELIDEFKDFECIDCAAMKKREILEKCPNRVVEIIAESIKQKNEAVTKASKQLLSWAKLPQVKAAIAKADEKTFHKLMEEFTKSIGSTEDFPMTLIKNGKLVFALTDTPITIDSLVKEWFDDRYLFESAQKNEAENARTYGIELKQLVTLISKSIGYYTPSTTRETIQRNVDALGFIANANFSAQRGEFNNAIEQLKQAKKAF